MAFISPAVSPTAVLLYVEDDSYTVRIFQIVLEELAPGAQLFSFSAGGAALNFLRRQPPYAESPTPDLVILDIELPGENGVEILTKIREDARLASLPALFFSTSDPKFYQERANTLGALAFVPKPINLREFENAMKFMLEQIPPRDAAR